jgi:hypothetical protein
MRAKLTKIKLCNSLKMDLFERRGGLKMLKMKIGKITRMHDGASVGYLKESLPLDLNEEQLFDFVQQHYIFSYSKIDKYRGESEKEMQKRGFGVGSIVVFWADEENRIIKIKPIVF